MELKELDEEKVCSILNEIVEYEMAGVVRYAHSSLMVSGPYRLPIVAFLQEQANESLTHALQAGELITGFGGHPSQVIATRRTACFRNKKDVKRLFIAKRQGWFACSGIRYLG